MTHLTRGPIAIDQLVAEVSAPECGGTCLFLGTVRNGPEESGVVAIEYTAYADMADTVYLQRVREDIEGGSRSGVRATPTFFLNGMIADVSAGLQRLFDQVEAALRL